MSEKKAMVRARCTRPTRKNNHAPKPVYHIEVGETTDKAEADRWLALAQSADDLLAALEEAERFMAGFEGDGLQDPPVDDRLKRMRAVIAAAKGGIP